MKRENTTLHEEEKAHLERMTGLIVAKVGMINELFALFSVFHYRLLLHSGGGAIACAKNMKAAHTER